jgi:hypothetical protein
VRLRTWALAMVAAGALGVAGCREQPAASVPVVSLDAELRLQPDGSIIVTEQWQLPPGPQPASLVRRLTTVRHDGVTDVTATAEDPQLQYAGQVETSPGGTRVVWQFGDVPARRLRLSYRARGATYVSGLRGRIAFEVLAPGHGLAIERAQIDLLYPERSIVMADPWVEEAGWQVERLPAGVRATRVAVPPSEPVTIGGEFSIDGLGLAEPAWQYHGARAKEFMPAFVSAGLFLVVVGAGVVGMVRLRHPARLPAEADPERPEVARGLRTSGLVTIAAALAGVPLVAATLSTYGPWPYCLPAGTFIAGLMFLWMSRRLRGTA